MSSDIAIKVENISKCYQIYEHPQDRLKQSIYPRLQQFLKNQPKQYYQEFWALKDISFEIKKGETVGIIGRNGSGKSTLLQIICGTLNPTSGSLYTNGRIAALLELGSGFNPEFTGRENVYINAAILGLSQTEIESKLDNILGFADIGDFVDKPVKIYSSGMMVRLAFAVAINVDPQILIVDEALSVGDEVFQRKCFSRIEAIKQKGTTILFVSHSGVTVVELCDHAVLLDSGEKLAMGVPKTILGKYQKLIYAPQDKRHAIREAIRSSEADGWKSKEASHSVKATSQLREKKHTCEIDPEEFFDPNLKSQSALPYETHGVYIETPEILTLSGEKVNCLKRGKTYRYSYKVRFDKRATNVRFGMLIKTTTGLELGGSVSAPSVAQSIPYLTAGTRVSVEFQFTCNLNPGSYFFNAGITGNDGEQETYLHRVLDIFMFKVMPVSDNTVTGMIDFNCTAEIDILNDPLQKAAAD